MQIKSISGKTLCNHQYDADNCEHCGKYEHCRIIVAQQREIELYKDMYAKVCEGKVNAEAQNKAMREALEDNKSRAITSRAMIDSLPIKKRQTLTIRQNISTIANKAHIALAAIDKIGGQT
jgi:transcription elongation factor Elf1